MNYPKKHLHFVCGMKETFDKVQIPGFFDSPKDFVFVRETEAMIGKVSYQGFGMCFQFINMSFNFHIEDSSSWMEPVI